MRRRPAPRIVLSIPMLAVVVALAACGGAPRDTASPPPITAAKAPAPSPSPTTVPSPTPSPAQAAADEPSQPATLPTVTTSAPGAIPPAPLPAAGAQASPAPEDPLKWLQDKQARKADYDRRLEQAKAAVAAAEPEVERWQKNVLAIKNPFLPPPRFTAEEADAIRGRDNVARLKFAEDKLAEAQDALAGAQKALDELKANPVSL